MLGLDRLKIGGATPSPTPSLHKVKERPQVPGLALKSVFVILLPQLLNKQFDSNDGGWYFLAECVLQTVPWDREGTSLQAGFCTAPLMWEHVEGGLSVICISSSLLAGHGRAKCAPPQGVPWGELEVNSGFCILFCFF